jgi:hypothetical protein
VNKPSITTALVAATLAVALSAQQQPPASAAKGKQAAAAKEYPEDYRPPLFFRETWKNPLETDHAQEPKVRQDHMTNPNLELKLYGPDTKDIRIVRHTAPADDPTYIWSGSSPTNWALTMRDKSSDVDLRGPVAKIRWRTKEAGFHLLRPVLKLADGTFLVAIMPKATPRTGSKPSSRSPT